MDPLDPEYSFKFLTGGAPIKIEKVLDIEVKPDSLKTTAIVTAVATTVLAGAAAAYYWFQKMEDESDQQHKAAEDEEEDEQEEDTIITTMTTTTTTTSYLAPPQPISTTTTSNTSTRLPLQPPKPTTAPVKLTDDNGQPLPLEEQNRLLLSENKSLKKDVENMNNWVNDQMSNFEDRLSRLEINNFKRVHDLESDLEKERLCGICQEHEKQVCWTTCGHRLCARCAVLIKSSLSPICPHCRHPVDNFVRCYNT